jgi:hypothetical protein
MVYIGAKEKYTPEIGGKFRCALRRAGFPAEAI